MMQKLIRAALPAGELVELITGAARQNAHGLACDGRVLACRMDWKNWKMRSVMMGVSLILAALGTVVPARAQSPTADFSQLLARECDAIPAPPAVTNVSYKQAGLLVMAYASQIDSYQSCLHQVVQQRRGALSSAEQTLLAGHLSKAANLLQRLRLDYGDAIRGVRDTTGSGEAPDQSVTG